MLQAHDASAEPGRSPNLPPIQFYSVEVTPLADGHLSVGVSATLCETIHEDDFEFVSMDMGSARVRSIDEALAVIRDAITSLH